MFSILETLARNSFSFCYWLQVKNAEPATFFAEFFDHQLLLYETRVSRLTQEEVNMIEIHGEPSQQELKLSIT